MPQSVGIRFVHAAVQAVADGYGVDLLHIKGPTVDEQLLDREQLQDPETGQSVFREVLRLSVDADVLVRPSHLDALIAAMRLHGWSTAYRFEDGSPFEHASTMHHASLSPLDVHRAFPGIGVDPEVAFERLWTGRHTTLIAGYPCEVPSLTGQRLVLLLHAARGPVAGHVDVRRSWTEATEDERGEVEQLACDLCAEVALAAATGRLDEFRASREHALWAALSTGETSPVRVWAARVRAEPTRWAAFRTAVRLVLPKPGRLAESLGRPPTRREIAAAYVDRTRWGVAEVGRFVQSRARRRAQ